MSEVRNLKHLTKFLARNKTSINSVTRGAAGRIQGLARGECSAAAASSLTGPIVIPGAGEKGGFSNKHLLGNSAMGVRSQKNS